METFLHSVAADLFARMGEGLSDCIVLMPNNRSRIFFVDALSDVAGRTLWSPRYASIDELMGSIADVGVVDPVRAAVELYKVYSRYHAESFDSFYYWGEVLRNDFDAIDKYMIDADRLFANIVDLKTLDADLSYLTPEQIELVKSFWSSFEGGRNSDEKARFLSLWRTLPTIYREFKAALALSGVATVGGMQRMAAEKIRRGEVDEPRRHYVVVGFNALSETEKIFFDYLRTAHDTDFYWDYDRYYLDDRRQEAGLFVRENVNRYPMPPTFVPNSDFCAPKEINVVSVASDSLQTKYASDFLNEIIARYGHADYRTAIVLTDEQLLSPLLYSLPDNVGKVNITMGYPIKGSLAYSFVERLLLLQHRARCSQAGIVSFYHADLTGLLSHPYLTSSPDGSKYDALRRQLLKEGRIYIVAQRLTGTARLGDLLFRRMEGWRLLSDYLVEVLSAIEREQSDAAGQSVERKLEKEMFEMLAEQICTLSNSLDDCKIDIDDSTYTSLLRRMLQSLRIPYSGEPLRGVQIMGILETRNLDFDNVMILSMSDDIFPSSRLSDLSFIPYNLRFAYGLPTPERSEGVYAYYFYRLLQRANRVDLVYCSVADERSSGEQSRYIYQLDYESPHRLVRRERGLDVNLAADNGTTVAKEGEVAARLDEYLSGERALSPTAMNDYVLCPLKFYFARVARIRIEDEISEEIDGSMFGNILHRAMQLLYETLVGVADPRERIAGMIGGKEVDEAILKAVAEKYFGTQSVSEDDLSGALMMAQESVTRYINRNILPFDAVRRGDYRIIALEHDISTTFEFDDGRTVLFGGKADRIDLEADGTLRIIDYKTGGLKLDFKGVESLLPELPADHNGAALQTLLYSMMADRLQRRGEMDGNSVCPMLYYVRSIGDPKYSPLLNDKTLGYVCKYADHAERFEALLAQRLRELFDRSLSFVQTDDRNSCRWCDFAKICRR